MSGLVLDLIPEMLGLVVTPAAVIACLLLLGSSRPLRNVAVFALAFLLPYLAISLLVVLGGELADADSGATSTQSWVSIGIGAVFLAGGVLGLVRSRRRPIGSAPPPRWAQALAEPRTRSLVVFGLVLSLLNPNIAILGSGLSVIVLSDVSTTDRLMGVLLLLAAASLDFLLPTLVFVVLGRRARSSLTAAKEWLVSHNQAVGIAVLLAFGLLFLARGAAALG